MKKIFILIMLGIFIFTYDSVAQFPDPGNTEVPDSVITWKFSGSGDSTLSVRNTYKYDSKLRIIESLEDKWESGINIWIPYRKDNNGFDTGDRQVLWEIYYWENEYSAYKGLIKETHEYDANGKELNYYYYAWNYDPFDWLNKSWKKNNYDENERLMRSDIFEWNTTTQAWDSTAYDLYEYKTEGMPDTITTWEPDPGSGIFYPSERNMFIYDAHGNVIDQTKQIYNYMTVTWYFTKKFEYTFDEKDRKTNAYYSEYDEHNELWIKKEQDEWIWDDNDSLLIYSYYRLGEDTNLMVPNLRSEMIYNDYGKMTKSTNYSGNNQYGWQATYMRSFTYKDDTLLLYDSLYSWNEFYQNWEAVDYHHYTYDSLFRLHCDNYFDYVVHTGQLELDNKAYYFYSETAGLAELPQDNFEVYPNPTSGKFQIKSTIRQLADQPNSKFRIQSIEVVDLYGKVVFSTNHDIRITNHELDISHLPPGIYLIRIKFENQFIVKKIIRN